MVRAREVLRLRDGVDPDLRLTQESLRASFAIPALCFAVVGLYALCFMERRQQRCRPANAQG